MDNEAAQSGKSIEKLEAEISQLKQRIVDLESAPRLYKNEPNYFNDRLAEEVARSTRYKYEFSILVTGMDNVEIYSNKYGKDAAAEIRAMLELAVNDTLRTTDLICKPADFEYYVILPYTDLEGGRIAAEKLRQAVERIFTLKSSAAGVRLTLSSGVASYPKNAVSAEELMMAAKEALKESVKSGGNRVCLAGKDDINGGSAAQNRLAVRSNDVFSRVLEEEVNRCSRYGQQFSLLLLAISSLEAKGTHLDATVKTAIITAVYRLLNTRIRTVDKAFLYSDTRFAVILPHTGHEGALSLAEKLRHSLTANPIFRNDGNDVNISINIGIAAFPTDAISGDALIERVETALTQANLKGANQVVLAPSFIDGFRKDGRNIKDLVEKLKGAGPQAVYNFLAIVDVTEHYERPHSHYVSKYSMATGNAMGLPANMVRRLRIMALLHDLGKVCLPDDVLTKPGALSDHEWDAMMKHPQYAAEILGQFHDYEFCCQPVLAHHERVDGKGYPRGLKGDEIPVESRIIAVAEAYDDMVTPRPYRQPVSSAEAVQELVNQSGRQFDASVVKAFIKALYSAQCRV